MRTNYVLIDYESVQPAKLADLEHDPFKVIVFVGASQWKLGFEAAAALQRMGPRASYVKISGNGPNALDFHIAFYIGQLSVAEPEAFFHIISKDAGFDPLIAHLKAKKVFAGRSKDISEIPLVRAASAKTPADRQRVILAKLEQLGVTKPTTVKTLSNMISNLFQKALSEEEVGSLVDGLRKGKHITVSGAKVTHLSSTSSS